MFNNNNPYYYPNEWDQMQSMRYNNAPQQEPLVQNLLSNEEIDEMRENTHQFNLALTPEEVKRNRCNHRDKNGRLATVPAGDGYKRCTVCGEIVKDVMYTKEEIQNLVDEMRNVFSVMKITYPSIPRDIAEQYYMVPAILKRIPDIMEIAMRDQDKLLNYNQYDMNGGNSMFGYYDALASNMFGRNMGGFVNPAMQGQYQQQQAPQGNYGGQSGPIYQQMQPYQQPNGYMGGSNGFGTNGPAAGGYTPNVTNYAYGQPQETEKERLERERQEIERKLAAMSQGDVRVTETLKA